MELPGINNRVVVEAFTWLGTPYKHQAATKKFGCDCVGLVIGIGLSIYGKLPADFKLPPYSPFWAEESGESLLVEYADKYLDPINIEDALPGDVLMFKMTSKGPTKHCGIKTCGIDMIHAYAVHGVVKTPLPTGKGVKLTHVFRFKENI